MIAICQWYLKGEKDNNCRCPIVRDLFSGRTLKCSGKPPEESGGAHLSKLIPGE